MLNLQLDILDYLLLLFLLTGTVINVITIRILLTHVYAARSRRLLNKIFFVSKSIGLYCCAVNFFSRKYLAATEYCYIFDFISNIVITYALNISIVIALQTLLELKMFEIDIFRSSCYTVFVIVIELVIAVVFNASRLYIGLENRKLLRQNGLQPSTEIANPMVLYEELNLTTKRFDCAIYSSNHLIMFDAMDLLSKSLIPFSSNMLMIVIIYKSLDNNKLHLNNSLRARANRYCSYAGMIGSVQFVMAATLIVINLAKHVTEYNLESKLLKHKVAFSTHESQKVIPQLVQIESIFFLNFTLIFQSFFAQYFHNLKFRKHFYQTLLIKNTCQAHPEYELANLRPARELSIETVS